MIFKDYYKILNLDTNRVTVTEIKNAYREQAKKYHPDVHIGSEERFKDINEAYRILSKPSTKRKYDRIWSRNVRNKATSRGNLKGQKSDLFTIFFGNVDLKDNVNKDEIAVKGENIETSIEIDLNEAYNGVTKRISLKYLEKKSKTIDVVIPKGIKDGEKIRIIGQGKTGKNGGKNGDLLIKIKIKKDNDNYLEGNNIRKILYLTPWEAVLGGKIEVEILNENISVYIPSNTVQGQVITIESKGYIDDQGVRGNLFLEIRIAVPEKISEEEEKLYKELKNISKFNPRK